MPRWPKVETMKQYNETPKRGRRPNLEKQTQTTKSNLAFPPSTPEKAFDFQPLEDKLNKRAQLELELRAAADREMGKLNAEIKALQDCYAQQAEYIHRQAVEIDALKASQTTKSWVKGLMGKLGLK